MSLGVNSSQMVSLSRIPVGVEKASLELLFRDQTGRLNGVERKVSVPLKRKKIQARPSTQHLPIYAACMRFKVLVIRLVARIQTKKALSSENTSGR
jgi:hypothetical protein